jgi:hypothetical protein
LRLHDKGQDTTQPEDPVPMRKNCFFGNFNKTVVLVLNRGPMTVRSFLLNRYWES